MITEQDRMYLQRCVELAEMALEKGDEPFGSLLVSAEGEVLFEDHNHVASGDHTQHPEFAIARFAAANLTPQQRLASTVYTSGEHCPMCAAAHGWVGLGKIVYASSAQQLGEWITTFGGDPEQSPVKPLPIQQVIRHAQVVGPVDEFTDTMRTLHQKNFNRNQ